MAYYKDDEMEEKLLKIKKMSESDDYKEEDIRELVSMQKGELSIKSDYYYGNIAEGNWSLAENDIEIRKLDEEKYSEIKDVFDIIYGIDEKKEKRERDAEYEYIFIPSYYAVKTLILYYIKNEAKANRVYGLKNAVVNNDGKTFCGGLPFILKYIDWILKLRDSFIDEGNEKKFIDSKYYEIYEDFKKNVKLIIGCIEGNEENNSYDAFLSDIATCIMDSYSATLKYEIRIEEMQNDDFPTDSRAMCGKLKGWFEQKVSSQKEKMVYKKDDKNKKIYIATVSDHYKYAEGRIKSLVAYV